MSTAGHHEVVVPHNNHASTEEHVLLQVLSNMVDFGMEPQEALDAPRFRLDGVDSCIGPASVNDVTCAFCCLLMVCRPIIYFPDGWQHLRLDSAGFAMASHASMASCAQPLQTGRAQF